ncbi:MAG: ATP-binding domain-containing protein, partial [Propionibacteriaceae bacterium]|nr:ATP-binding domain-containing protein [Propionibacteriaceae bacterium]
QDPQDQTRLENLVELVSVAAEFVTAAHTVDLPDEGLAAAAAEPDDSLPAFLERIALVADSDSLPDENSGTVTLMTLHTAKGLEFDTVFLTGFEDGIFPHMRALQDPGELQEERRLAYVGITRARKRLYLTRAVTRMMWGTPAYNPQSRFVDEIPGQLIDWRRVGMTNTGWEARSAERSVSSRQRTMGAAVKPVGPRLDSVEVGGKVMHSKFGLGTVIATDQDRGTADIRFKEAGVKRLSLQHAPLSKL